MKIIKLFVLISSVSALLFSCANAEEQKRASEEKLAELQDSVAQLKSQLSAEEVKLVSIIDKLRVRTEPNTKADIVGELKFNQRVLYLNEESDFKEKINLRGQAKTDTWKKIKYVVSGAAITGWAFGGGLVEEGTLYVREGDVFTRLIDRATGAEINRLLGLSLEEDYYYNGSINYKLNEAKALIKHGEFSLTAEMKSQPQEAKSAGIKIGFEVSGNFEMGKENGVFERKFNGYENYFVSIILFEDGECLWSSIKGSAEGTDYEHKIDNPASCSFSFIETSY